ncbi:MAG: hypothetical protein KF729_26480 [Sandaracinaceae bacterium]|nr:hypothetical protein [Sandaracinaceae bacterium]
MSTCPRCRVVMDEIRVLSSGKGGGTYRDVYATAWRCPRCGARLLERSTSGDLSRTLAGSMLVRAAKRAGSCDACLATMQKLTLSWAEEWVEIEECARCGRVIVDHGELERIRGMAHRAATSGVSAAIGVGLSDDPAGVFADAIDAFLREL